MNDLPADLTTRVAGVVFDCDGTLADTEPLSGRAWAQVLASRGVEVTPADLEAIIGHAWPRGYQHFASRADLGDPDVLRAELREASEALYDRELRLFPDTVAALVALTDAGVPVAVASSSTHAHVRRCLAREEGLLERVSVVVGADDVTRHKPDPEPYLRAAAALGRDPRDCTTVEDTATGLASARAAGTFTVAVVRGAVDPRSLVGADRVVDEVRVADLVPPRDWVSPAA